jgi:hypothetical protein
MSIAVAPTLFIERRDHTTGRHDRRYEPGFLFARQTEDSATNSICDPGLEQPARHDIDRPNGDHGRVRKAIKDFLGVDEAEQAN